MHIFTGILWVHMQKISTGKDPNNLKEMKCMSTNSSNRLVNPAAREAMDKFKMEAASHHGVLFTS